MMLACIWHKEVLALLTGFYSIDNYIPCLHVNERMAQSPSFRDIQEKQKSHAMLCPGLLKGMYIGADFLSELWHPASID